MKKSTKISFLRSFVNLHKNGSTYKMPPIGQAPAFLANITLGRKVLPVTNTIVYQERPCKVLLHLPLGHLRKLNDRNCCCNVKSQSVCKCFSLPSQSNICKQGQEPTIRVESVWCPTLVGSDPCKNRIEVNGSGKRSSLSQYGNTYVVKCFIVHDRYSYISVFRHLATLVLLDHF